MSMEDQSTIDQSVLPDDDRTLDTDDPPSSSEPQQLDRFELERLLGQGGMGQVWEAWDPQLERRVAIKRLLRADPAARRRFVREGRLQATLAHPGICPVFEVGHDAGEPYLVMPRLDGVRLDEAAEGEPLEYKLDLMRQVADAVHAAHQQGLIHRDLKPANILVEQPPDAPPRPVVLDFGIARSVGGEMLTAPGEVVGTPAFMAPEQVEGASVLLDRRTDVYALGATLYRLLSGRPPHSGTGTPLLFSIVHEEPERLPSGDIPAEVEAIVFKCLEKDKNRRYDSARALAEDLERYLAGEPVHARPVTHWIRFGKWMRRHRVAVRVTSAAALLAVAGLTWGGWSAWRSGERQEAARRFGAQVEEIEALARYSYLMPLHDAREDKEQLRARLEAIRPSLGDRDPIVQSLAYYALGRGHLALDELDAARGFLEKAYSLDPDNPEIATEFGRVLSEIYQYRLTTLERTHDMEGKNTLNRMLSSRLPNEYLNAADQQIDRRLQWREALEAPAEGLLEKSQLLKTTESVELDALALFHSGDPRAALELLTNETTTPSWAFERLHLEGNLRRSWGASLALKRERKSEARLQLEKAREAYSQALKVAPSHSAILRDDAQATILLVEMGLVPPEEAGFLIEEGQEILSKVRTIDPNGLQTWLLMARLEFAATKHDLLLEKDPSFRLEKTLRATQAAIALDSRSSTAWFLNARSHEALASWRLLNGGNATTSFEQAFEAFERVLQEDRDYSYYLQRGQFSRKLYVSLNSGRLKAPADISATYALRDSIAAYRSAVSVHSEPFVALFNLGSALCIATRSQDIHPQMLTEAIEHLERASRLRPNHFAPFYYLGLSRMLLAQEGSHTQMIVDETLAELAQADFETSIKLAPDEFPPWVGLGELFHLRAIANQGKGKDPTQYFLQAQEANNRALEISPDQPIAILNLAWTIYFEGKFALRRGQDPRVRLGQAKDLCRRALEGRHHPKSLLCLGSVLRMQAEYQVDRGHLKRAGRQIIEAEGYFQEILYLDTNHAEAHRSLGRLLTLESRRLRLLKDDPSLVLNQARNMLDHALARESSIPDFHLADARWYLEQAEVQRVKSQDPLESVAAGRQALSTALELNSDSQEVTHLEIAFEIFLNSL